MTQHRAGIVWDERYAWHDARSFGSADPWVEPWPSAEGPETKRRLYALAAVSGLLDDLADVRPRAATKEELLRFHTGSYVDRIERLSADTGGDAGDGGSAFGPGSYEIGRLAAGGAFAAVDAVLDGVVESCYALVRPPGHHAEADRGYGFCLFGNAALAAMHARSARGVGRIAIVDWDAHWGNGTQEAFYRDPDVLTISIHQLGLGIFRPGHGGLDQTGEGPGRGTNLNIPLPAGSGTGAFEATFDRVVAPALRAFEPELLMIASGLDTNLYDPLAHQLMHSEGFRALTRRAMELAAELCDGRLVLVHEGGYAQLYVPFCGLAVLEQLAGVRTAVSDPFLELAAALPDQALQPHQEAAIAAAAAAVEGVPGPRAHRSAARAEGPA